MIVYYRWSRFVFCKVGQYVAIDMYKSWSNCSLFVVGKC